MPTAYTHKWKIHTEIQQRCNLALAFRAHSQPATMERCDFICDLISWSFHLQHHIVDLQRNRFERLHFSRQFRLTIAMELKVIILLLANWHDISVETSFQRRNGIAKFSALWGVRWVFRFLKRPMCQLERWRNRFKLLAKDKSPLRLDWCFISSRPNVVQMSSHQLNASKLTLSSFNQM